jgi:clan AA aspartic protease
MITGVVRGGRQATVRLRIRGTGGQEQDVEAVIDTGFTGSLTIPPSLITGLGLLRAGWGRAILADGSRITFDLYEATVIWDGQPLRVSAHEAATDALIGMKLLRASELRIQVVDGGDVTISPLTP